VAGCTILLAALTGFSDRASAQSAPESFLELHLVDGALPTTQRSITVHKGERLRWRITSDAAGELHLHAYRLSAQLRAGQPEELAFTAFASGRFRLEWHPAQDKSAAPVAQHAPTLAVLDVLPN
jgi:hypothetical protein